MERGDVACARQASRQRGVLSRGQALERLTRRQIDRRLESGLWERLFPSVYRLVAAARSWQQTLEALALWAGRGSVLSHESAAALHGFAHFKPGRLVVTARRHLRAPPQVELHLVEQLHPADVSSVLGLPVTSVPRTLLDLAARVDGRTLRATLDEALRRRLTSLEALQRLVERSAHRPGVVDLRAAVAEVDGSGGPTESELERDVLELLREAGFPTPQRQRPVHMDRRRRRLDFLFPQQRVVLEADGYEGHSTREMFESDRRRDNWLTARGFRVLRWTWSALRQRPGALLEELAALLGR